MIFAFNIPFTWADAYRKLSSCFLKYRANDRWSVFIVTRSANLWLGSRLVPKTFYKLIEICIEKEANVVENNRSAQFYSLSPTKRRFILWCIQIRSTQTLFILSSVNIKQCYYGYYNNTIVVAADSICSVDIHDSIQWYISPSFDSWPIICTGNFEI